MVSLAKAVFLCICFWLWFCYFFAVMIRVSWCSKKSQWLSHRNSSATWYFGCLASRAPSRWIFPWPSWCLWKARAMGWSPSSRPAGVGMVPLWWGDTLDIQVTLHMQVPCPDSKREGIFWDAPPPTVGTIRNVYIYIIHMYISVIYSSPAGDCYWIREHPQVSS